MSSRTSALRSLAPSSRTSSAGRCTCATCATASAGRTPACRARSRSRSRRGTKCGSPAEKLPESLRPRPASYPQAVESLASSAPPGYRDWDAAGSDRKREALIAGVASLIADQPIVSGGWGNWLSKANRRSVPRRWVGDPSLLPAVGALEKSAPNVTVRVFERWLRVQGIKWVPGMGSHRDFHYDGQRHGYGTSGGSGRLVFKDAKRLAKVFEYPTVTDFLIAVAAKERLPTTTTA